jgi:hypothetical protein
LITTVSIFAYKIASPSNKFADDQKIERFLNQTADMSSAHFDIEFDQLCESGSDFCVPAFRQLNEAFVRKIVVSLSEFYFKKTNIKSVILRLLLNISWPLVSSQNVFLQKPHTYLPTFMMMRLLRNSIGLILLD